MAKKKKQYVEEGIFSIYPDFPILIKDNIIWRSHTVWKARDILVVTIDYIK